MRKHAPKKKDHFLGLFLPAAVQLLINITDLWDIVPIALRVSIVLTIQATLTSDTVSFVPDSTRSLGAQGGHAFAMPLSCLYYTKLHQATLTERPFHLFLDHPDSLLLELTLTFRSKQEPFGPQLSRFQSPDHPTVGYILLRVRPFSLQCPYPLAFRHCAASRTQGFLKAGHAYSGSLLPRSEPFCLREENQNPHQISGLRHQ